MSIVNVTKLDHSTEAVEVRLIAIADAKKFVDAQADECKIIELVTGKPSQWVDSLTPDSHERLISVIDDENLEFVARWFARRIARAERMSPGIVKRLAETPKK